MSLFQAREWWYITCGINEEFSPGSFAIGNVDNEENSKQGKIVTGSLQGMLRIYSPQSQDYKIEHLLAEESLGHPILQIEIGKFIPNSSHNAIAILHPRQLAVYFIESAGGFGADASYFKIRRAYLNQLGENNEHFTAYNMTCGFFGHSKDKEYICVQSLDGNLQFFQQGTCVFVQQLPNCLIPCSFTYFQSIDSFIFATGELTIACYKYQNLATSQQGKKISKSEEDKDVVKQENPSNNKMAGKKLQADWILNIGEFVIDIKVSKFDNKNESSVKTDIIVLGEFSIFWIKPQGSIKIQKRLGYPPSCICLYAEEKTESGVSQKIIVGSNTKHWMIYKNYQLSWSACTQYASLALNVTHIKDYPGMIVSLSQDGHLSVSYLGTDPPTQAVASGEQKDVNFEEMDEEHRHLIQIIRHSQTEKRTEPRDRILLRAQLPGVLDKVVKDEFDEFGGINYSDIIKNFQGQIYQLTMRIYITFTGKGNVRNVTLSINPPQNILVNQRIIHIPCVEGSSSTPLILPILLRPSTSDTPTSLTLTCSAAYILDSGQPRVTLLSTDLPLCLFCRCIPPVKQNNFKLNIKTSASQSVSLFELFGDLLTQPIYTSEFIKQVTTSNYVLSIQYFNGLQATILGSKESGNYRIQSGEIESLCLITKELTERLKSYYKRIRPDNKSSYDDDQKPYNKSIDDKDEESNISDNIEIIYDDPLPLADFFSSIDNHFNLRKQLSSLVSDLNDRSHQFRMVQKRLLIRYKDRNPPALNNLEVILHTTYEQILGLSNEIEFTANQLKLAANRLSSSVALVLLLMKLKFQIDEKNFELLAAHLTPDIKDPSDCTEQGWEEIVNCNMTQLLRSALSKNTKESNIPLPNEIELLSDTKKLKKHITIVCDRIGKGGKPLAETKSPLNSNKSSTADEKGGLRSLGEVKSK